MPIEKRYKRKPETEFRRFIKGHKKGNTAWRNGLPGQTTWGLFLPCTVSEFRRRGAKRKVSPFAHDAACPKRKDYGKKAESTVTTSVRLPHGAEYRVVSTGRSSGM